MLWARLAPGGAQTEDVPDVASKRAIEQIIRDFIWQHPETILESIQAMQEHRRAAEKERTKPRVVARQADLVSDPTSPVGGNPSGDVTVVEFFDYRCSHCRSVLPTLKRLLESDANIRVVYKEFPILGDDSIAAARNALAAHAQGKYLRFHDALMASSDPVSPDTVLKVAIDLGLDVTTLRAAMEAPEINAILQRNRALAQDLWVTGTPAFAIDNTLCRGAVSLGTLKELIARARLKSDALIDAPAQRPISTIAACRRWVGLSALTDNSSVSSGALAGLIGVGFAWRHSSNQASYASGW